MLTSTNDEFGKHFRSVDVRPIPIMNHIDWITLLNYWEVIKTVFKPSILTFPLIFVYFTVRAIISLIFVVNICCQYCRRKVTKI